MKRAILRVAVMCLIAVGLSAQTAAATYTAGQVWEYKSRPQDRGSLLKIQRVTALDGKSVYHLSIVGVRFARQGLAGVLPHTPVSKETLDASVTKQSTSAALFPTSAVDDGIAEWQRAQGGVFTIPVAEIIEIVDEQTSQASLEPAN